MEKHYEKEDISLYLQDVFEVLKELPYKSLAVIYLQHGRALVKEGKIIDFEINIPNFGEFGWI